MNESPTANPAVKPTVWIVLCLSIVLVASFATPATAQGPENSNAEDTTKAARPAAPVPIPAAQLTTQAEEAASLLRQMRDRPVRDDEIDRIERELPGTLAKLQQLMDLTDAALAKSTSSRTLDDLQSRWQRYRDLIDRWRSRVARRARSVDRDMQSLQSLRRTWEVTLDAAADWDVREAVIPTINTTLEHIRREEARFGVHRAQLLSIGLKLAQAEDMIADAFDQINAAKKELRMRLYAFDAPPLWSALAHPQPPADYLAQIREVAFDAGSELKEFAVDYRNWLIVHGLVLVLLILLIRSLRKRVQRLQLEEQDLDESINIVSRPFSSALLLALAGLLFFYRSPPRIVGELTTILCFLPLYRILPRKVFRNVGDLLIWLICLHVVDRVTDILPYLSLVRRLLLLLLTTITFGVLYRAIKRETTRRFDAARPLRRIEKIAAFLLVVALVSNVLGNLSLAGVITSAVILSAYAGLVLYAIYLVIDTVLSIGLGTRVARAVRMVRRHGDLIHRRIMTVLRLGFYILWLVIAFHNLQILPLAVEVVRKVLGARAQFGDIGVSVGGVLAFAVTVWAAFFISRIVRFILEEDVYPRMTLPRGVPNAISTGLHYAVLLIAFILAIAATGVDLGKFAILAGAFGVGIGFGLQNVVNNFISGLILIVERPIMPGDTVEFGDKVGDVKRIGLRSSTIRTWSGAEVIVPNGNLISGEVINWTLSDRQRRLDVPVGVAYGSPVKQVMEILANVAAQHNEILENPTPRALFRGFGNSSLDFELRCWTANFEQYIRIMSDLVVAIEAALNEAKIVIPFPQRDLHVKTVDTDAGRGLRGEPPPAGQRRPAPANPDPSGDSGGSGASPRPGEASAPPESGGADDDD